jgi:sec-independent protein translocase protein TatA
MTTLLFIGGLGGWEVLLIVAIVLILFGAKKIPELARGLGTGIREFKNATTEVKKEIDKDEEKPSSHQSTEATSAGAATTAASTGAASTAATTAKPPTESATASPTPPADPQVEEVKVEEEERKTE